MDNKIMRRKGKKLAKKAIMYWLSTAWHEFESPAYSEMSPLEKEVAKSYIHHYCHLIAWMLGKNYIPQ